MALNAHGWTQGIRAVLACALWIGGAPAQADTAAAMPEQARQPHVTRQPHPQDVPTLDEMRAVLASMGSDAMLSRMVARRFGPNLAADKRALAITQYRRLLQEPATMAFMLQMMRRVLEQGGNLDAMRNAAAEAAQPVVVRGLGRLPIATQRAFNDYRMAMYQSLPGRQCNKMLDASTDPMAAQAIEDAWLATQSLARFEFALRTATEASLAEVLATQAPPQADQEPDAATIERALQRYDQLFDRLIKPQLTKQVQARAAVGRGQGREACAYGATIMQAMAQLGDADYRLVWTGLTER